MFPAVLLVLAKQTPEAVSCYISGFALWVLVAAKTVGRLTVYPGAWQLRPVFLHPSERICDASSVARS
jgi:hypothetical protein